MRQNLMKNILKAHQIALFLNKYFGREHARDYPSSYVKSRKKMEKS